MMMLRILCSVNQYASRLIQHLLSSLYVLWLKNTAKEEYLRLFVLIGLDFLIYKI